MTANRRPYLLYVAVFAPVCAAVIVIGVRYHHRGSCSVVIEDAKIENGRCVMVIKSQMREEVRAWTLQQKIHNMNEEWGAWVRSNSSTSESRGFLGTNFFVRKENIHRDRIVMPFVEGTPVEWYVKAGDHFQLKRGEERLLWTCKARGDHEEVDVRYLIRCDK